MSLFSKEGPEGLNVHDMQCMWYENEVAYSHLRQGNYRLALKNFTFIERHLEQIWDDQTDFHLYAMRKYTLNSYLHMLKMEDKIYKNAHAINAAIGMIKTVNKITSDEAKLQNEKDQLQH